MTKGNDIVSAFEYQEEYGDHGRKYPVRQLGLTKREYFAAMAMQGLIIKQEFIDTPIDVAESAIKYADALIEQLNK